MSYTLSLIRTGVDLFIPCSDKLPLIGEQSEEPKVSKAAERARIAVGQAISKKSPSLRSAGLKMVKKGKRKIAEKRYGKDDYSGDQLVKASYLVDALVPGTGAAATVIFNSKKVNDLQTYADETSYIHPETLKKAIKVGASLTILAVTPMIKPFLTTTALATVALGALGVALTLDALNFMSACDG